MKSHLVLILLIILGLVLLAGAGILFYLSNTTEFSRAEAVPPPRLAE